MALFDFFLIASAFRRRKGQKISREEKVTNVAVARECLVMLQSAILNCHAFAGGDMGRLLDIMAPSDEEDDLEACRRKEIVPSCRYHPDAESMPSIIP